MPAVSATALARAASLRLRPPPDSSAARLRTRSEVSAAAARARAVDLQQVDQLEAFERGDIVVGRDPGIQLRVVGAAAGAHRQCGRAWRARRCAWPARCRLCGLQHVDATVPAQSGARRSRPAVGASTAMRVSSRSMPKSAPTRPSASASAGSTQAPTRAHRARRPATSPDCASAVAGQARCAGSRCWR